MVLIDILLAYREANQPLRKSSSKQPIISHVCHFLKMLISKDSLRFVLIAHKSNTAFHHEFVWNAGRTDNVVARKICMSIPLDHAY